MLKELKDGSVTSPAGYKAAGIHAGIKADAGVKDLALVYSEPETNAAAVYTTNRVQAAPIAVDRKHLSNGRAQALIVNSGNANACTGERGRRDAEEMCAATASALGLESEQVLVCSTGVIGVPLPMSAVEAGIPKVAAAVSESGGVDAAEAIMTTDTVPKHYAVELEIGGKPVRIGGMSKGAGMIAPNMATMIALVTTDAAIESTLLQKLLGRAASRSFNGITVDGDMSTNDTLIVMANGASGVEVSMANSSELEQFTDAFETVCRHLARAIARDGEGATKLVTIGVSQAKSEAEARQVGLAVANSNLVKTAVFGRDPNWGRILCAVGYSGVEIDPDRVKVHLCGVPIYEDGAGIEFDNDGLIEAMGAPDIPIEIELGRGDCAAELYTCDFSYEYVRINAEYTT
jgi:glutamate N-acetyltransferase/amino-acid N-acetyltransferase